MKGLQRWLTKTSALAGVEGRATKAIPKWRDGARHRPAKAWGKWEPQETVRKVQPVDFPLVIRLKIKG